MIEIIFQIKWFFLVIAMKNMRKRNSRAIALVPHICNMSSPRKLSLQRAIFKPTIWPKTHHFPIPNIITAKIIILQGCRNLILIVDDWINTIPCIWEGLIKDRWIGGPFSSRGWYFWEKRMDLGGGRGGGIQCGNWDWGSRLGGCWWVEGVEIRGVQKAD